MTEIRVMRVGRPVEDDLFTDITDLPPSFADAQPAGMVVTFDGYLDEAQELAVRCRLLSADDHQEQLYLQLVETFGMAAMPARDPHERQATAELRDVSAGDDDRIASIERRVDAIVRLLLNIGTGGPPV